MPGILATSCLYSTVVNASGGRKKFGFLPPHGRELAAGEEYTIWGDVREAVIRNERTEARRNIIAFEHALQRGDITILHTPNVIMEDELHHDVPKMLRLRNGALSTVDPCWTQSASLSMAPIG